MKVLPGQPPAYSGTWDCLTKTVKNEGVRGLYKGMAAPLAGVSPIFAISFFGYGVGKKIFQADKQEYKTLRTFSAGAFSGIFTTIIMSPGERIKCLLQIQQGSANKKYNGPVDVAKQLYKEGGIRSVYRGAVATMLRGNILQISINIIIFNITVIDYISDIIYKYTKNLLYFPVKDYYIN